uniref:NKAP domain containing 1 n=1 Tax=Lepisosteus oculatus TaxID=7918 RepID=W5M058_LEPOC
MSRVPMGKVLLRNVIRHTDAHNKVGQIQEESEMWKMREKERQTLGDHARWHRRKLDHDLSRGRMRCDGFDEEELPGDGGAATAQSSEGDVREARHWTKKLYEFEAGDPDRWGHSGFKELYPEEFETDSDQQCSDGENIHRREKAPRSASPESGRRKRSKKTLKKKTKKKAKKRKKEEEPGKRRKKSSKEKRRKRRKEKGPGGRKDSHSSSSSSSEDEETGGTPRGRRKRPHEARAESEHEEELRRKRRRRNWKVADEEKSEDSSED